MSSHTFVYPKKKNRNVKFYKTMEISMEDSKEKLKSKFCYDTGIISLEVYPKDCKSYRDTWILIFVAAIFITVKK